MAGGAEELTEKTDKMTLKEERQQQIAIEEMNYNESEILKAFEALMKEDPRCPCGRVFLCSCGRVFLCSCSSCVPVLM